MDALMEAKGAGEWDNNQGFLGAIPEGLGLKPEPSEDSPQNPAADDSPPSNSAPDTAGPVAEIVNSDQRSEAVAEEPALVPPFWGSQVLNESEIDLEEVFAFLDRSALFAGQWQIRKAQGQSRQEYDDLLIAKAEPVLQQWKQRCMEEGLLTPRVAYGYFPCGRQGNTAVVFDPSVVFDPAVVLDPATKLEPNKAILGRFELPRQRAGNRYCIADFYRDCIEGPQGDLSPTDVLPMQAVTMGEKASEFAQELFKADKYTDYLYFHGLAVQMAEALAEWVHARIRRELGFAAEEPAALRDVLAQRYRGSRYSFGYPACPNVADSRQQLDWLGAGRIGLSMDESDQLAPEQSTTALVAMHSKARYFSA
jgi:5-methyltetrahydrofolate--homocysteine methyltransferase